MIKFRKHFVTDGKTKVRVRYSLGDIIVNHKDRTILKDAITIYDKDFGHNLKKVFPQNYVNNSISIEDYCEHGRIILRPDHSLYSQAKEIIDAN